MPDFTFTSPEGKNYTVTAPEGASKQQAYAMLQRQLNQVPSSMANHQTTREAADPEEVRRVTHAGRAILGAGMAGGALGAVAPEVVSGAGVASLLVPGVGEVVGPPLIAAGRAMRGARLAESAWGAVSGLTSETAGQGAEALGAGKTSAFASRVVGGMAGPGVIGGAMDLAKFSGRKALQLVHAITGSTQPEKMSAMALKHLEITGHPMNDTRALIAQGLAHDAALARQQGKQKLAKAYEDASQLANKDPAKAKQLVQQAEREASVLTKSAQSRAMALERAAGGKLQQAGKVQAQAEPALHQIAPYSEVSDIGESLRSDIDSFAAKQYTQRAEKYQALKSQRDAVVRQKEGAKIFMSDMPAMKGLQKELETKLLSTRRGQAAAQGKASVTDPGLRKAYADAYEAISNRRVQTGMDKQGNPTFTTFRTTFEAIDAVRRRLGDVISKPGTAEGYSALGKQLAGDLYAKLSQAQKQYAGPLQKQLQTEYANDSQALEMFSGKTGKAALDRMRDNPEEFVKDMAKLPEQYFKTASSVKGLKQVLGGTAHANAMVERSASRYAVNQLAGHDHIQVEKWIKDNNDWLREVPETRKKVQAYAQELEQIETRATRLTGEAKEASAKGQKYSSEATEAIRKGMLRAKEKAAQLRKDSLKRPRRLGGMGVGTVGGIAGGAVAGRDYGAPSEEEQQ